jgi:translation initiation factor IF-2
MGKKRIFELARDLGYQNNRDLIDQLQKLGFEVKSHSSTVEEDDVRVALKKAEEGRKAATDERRVSRTVIRRRSKDGGTVVRRRAAPAEEAPAEPAAAEAPAEPVTAEAPAAAEPQPEAPTGTPATPEVPAPEPARTPPEEVVAERTAPEPQAEAPAATAAAADADTTAAVDEAIETTTAPEAAETTAAAETPAPEPQPAPEEQAVEVRSEGEPATAAAPTEEEPAERAARAARPERRTREEAYDEEDEKPDVEDFGFDEFDFAEREDDDEKGQRVAPPPPSSVVTASRREEQQPARITRRIDPNVLKARLKQSKRPEPPKEWGKPQPPEEVPASPVTELVVRTDASGKRKELVDVRKEAKKKSTGARRREEMSAKDLLEHRRGQVYYPAPNRKRVKNKRPAKKQEPVHPVTKQPVEIGETITINDLSQQMGIKATQIISWLMRNGVMAGINQPIEHDTAVMVCDEFGYEVRSAQFVEEERFAEPTADVQAPQGDLEPRPPVVTVMGHVDHGKTSLLDRIRKTNVAAGEAGGITQRIAGYQVPTSRGEVTFLDTPGHAAFSQMRARGANVTDIVVLVVAADDGVMPQTREAIDHAKSAEVPIIIAVNKVDKPEANPDRVLQQLADHGLLVEDWGGDTLMRKISAKTGDGVEELLELIALQSEIMELKASPQNPAIGTVIEGHVHKGRGPVATILVNDGTLQKGDTVVVGENLGKVRAMMTDGGKNVKEATPGMPVEILGLDGVPHPGDELRVAADLSSAKELVAHRREKRRAAELTGSSKVSLQELFARAQSGEQKELRVILKADVQGSVEALKDALTGLSTQKVKVSVISTGVGAVVESDIEFAVASEAIVIGFGVRPDTKALKAARASGVDVRTYSVIYEAVDEVKLAMRGLLSPVEKEKYLGRAEVRQTFNVPKVGTVAGCAVVDGIITRNANIRLLRDSRPIYDGKLASLKRFKDDVREVREGFECGMNIERFNDVKEGDIIEAYEIVMQEAPLDEPTSDEARA